MRFQWRACTTLAVVGLLLQGAPAAHMVLVEHVRCAEHGELAHGELDHGTGGETARTERCDLRSDSGSQSGHDHCAQAAERQDMIAVGATMESSRLLRQPGQHFIVGDAPQGERDARYRLAPKSSPPT